MEEITHLLNYTTTHPNAKIQYHKSGIIIHSHSNGSYLCDPMTQIRVGGYFLLSEKNDPIHCKLNGSIHVIEKIQKNVIGSAPEAKIGAIFINVPESVTIHPNIPHRDKLNTTPKTNTG